MCSNDRTVQKVHKKSRSKLTIKLKAFEHQNEKGITQTHTKWRSKKWRQEVDKKKKRKVPQLVGLIDDFGWQIKSGLYAKFMRQNIMIVIDFSAFFICIFMPRTTFKNVS